MVLKIIHPYITITWLEHAQCLHSQLLLQDLHSPNHLLNNQATNDVTMRLEKVQRILGFEYRGFFFHVTVIKTSPKWKYSIIFKKKTNTPTNTQNSHIKMDGLIITDPLIPLKAAEFVLQKSVLVKLSWFEHLQGFNWHLVTKPFEAFEWIVHTCSQRNVLHTHAFLWRKWWISIVISTILVYNGLLRMFSWLDAIALRIFQKTNERCPQPPASSTLCTHDSPRNTRSVLSCRFCNKQNGRANEKRTLNAKKNWSDTAAFNKWRWVLIDSWIGSATHRHHPVIQ